jgi:arabinose-5-phosphate isomerase
MEISEKRLGVTAVMEQDKIVGIITDGDIRRMLNKTETITGLTAKDIMTTHAKSIKSTDLVSDALDVLENFAITQLAVIDDGEYKGIIHLHDILKEGII